MASISEIMSEPQEEMEAQEGITVAIRMRPLNKAEGEKRRIWKVLPKYNSVTQTTSNGKPLSERVTGRTFFTFDKVFGEEIDTVQVYDSVAKGIVSSVVNGLNGTIFAYGQTSSGKTFTMQGSGSIEEGAASAGGVVHMAARDIFANIQSQPDRMFLVRASFLEIYNEEVRDLLSSSNQTLQIREDPRRGVFVHSQEEMVTNFESLLRILFHGEKSRAIASTGMNERSSRSHTIFRITIESREKESDDDGDEYSSSGGDGAVRVSTLNLVDLAGSESVRHTGATGERQKEGGMINQSLLTLSRVIVALGQPNQTHINFRDSKLTRILQPSLSGNARMAVICCATPSEMYLEETRSTLQFASRAKLVKTNAQVNEVLDDRSIIRRLQRELAEARGQTTGGGTEHLRDLENKAASAGTAAMEANAKLNRLKNSILNASYLFGGNRVGASVDPEAGQAIKPTYNLRSRKRRQSDGEVALPGRSTPQKSLEQAVSSPKTTPRKKKEKRIHPVLLSPQSELSILRQALSSRNELSRSLKETLEKNAKLLCAKQDEVETLISQNDGLADEKERAFYQLSQVEEALAAMQANLDATIAEYDTLLAEKENVILEAFQKVESENSKVSGLEKENASLSEELQSLQQRFDALQEERIRSAFELAQSTEEKEKLQADREKDQQALQEMNRKVGLLTTNANDAEKERAASEDIIRDLQEQLSSAQEEKGATCERLAALEADLAGARAEAENERQANAAAKGELELQHQTVTQLQEEKQLCIAELETARSALDATQSELHAVVLDKEQTEQNLHSQIGDLQDQLSSVQEEKGAVFAQLAVLEADLAGARAEADNERQAYAAAKEELELQLQTILEEGENARSALDAMQSELQAVILDKEQTDQNLHSQIRDLQDQLSSVHEEKGAAFEQLAVLEADLAGARAEADNERQANAAAKEELELQLQNVLEEGENARSALDAMQSELQAVILDKEQTEQNLRSQVTSLEFSIVSLEAELASVKEEFEVLALESKDASVVMEEELRLSTMQIEALESEKATLEHSIVSLEAELLSVKEESEARVLESKEALVAMEEELRLSNMQIEALESEKASLSAAGQETLQTCRQELEGTLSMLASAREENARLREELSVLQSTYVSLRTQVTAKEIEKADLVNQIGTLSTELETMRSECISLESNVEALQQNESSLIQELTSLREERSRREADFSLAIAVKDEALQNHESENGQLRDENKSLHESLRNLQDEKASLQEKLQSVLKAKSMLSSESENLQERLAVMIHEKVELDRFLSAAEEEANSLQEQKAAMESELAELQGALTATQQEFDELKERTASLETENAALAEDKSNLGAALESLKSEGQRHQSSMEEELQDLRETRCELETTIESFQQAIDDLSLENNELKENINRYEVDKIEMETRIMMLEADKMKVLTEKDSFEVGRDEQLRELEDQLEERNHQIENLTTALQEKIQVIENLRSEKSSIGDQVVALQVQYENVNRALQQCEINLSAAQTSKDNALATLRDREKERDEAVAALEELYEKNQELSRDLASSLSIEKEDQLQKELGELKHANSELKQLLASSTGSEARLREKMSNAEAELNSKCRELEDAQYRLSQLEEELRQSELAFEEKLALSASDGTENQDAALLHEIKSLHQLLEQERAEHQQAEERLKQQMGDEQRALIQEGEKLMDALRSKALELEKKLCESEQEAYTARQQLQDLRDRNEAAESNCLELQAKLDSFKSAVDMEESRVASLQAELNNARAESYSLRENAVDLKEKLRKAMADMEDLSGRKDMASSEVAVLKRQMANVEKAKVELQTECDRLKAKLRSSADNDRQSHDMQAKLTGLQELVAAKDETIKSLEQNIGSMHSENEKLRQGIDGNSSLLIEVKQLKTKIKEKDQRIKKLEAVKLTKEFAEEHKQLKKDNKILRDQVADLKMQLSSTSDSAVRTELSELRFDKEALESKLRKFASHCQRLEDDKAGMALALRSCNIDTSEYDGDVNEAVIALCDKLTSLQEVESVRSRRGSSDSNRLESENAALQSKLDRLVLTEEKLSEQVTKYQAEIEVLQKKVKNMAESNSDSVGENGEMSRKLRYLEQENLQLMFDNKTTKKQLQAAREEIENLRMQAMDNSTLDFGTVDLGSDSSQISKSLKASKLNSKPSREAPVQSGKTPLYDKTNKGTKQASASASKYQTVKLSSAATERLHGKAPGLGEAALQGDETGECTQS